MPSLSRGGWPLGPSPRGHPADAPAGRGGARTDAAEGRLLDDLALEAILAEEERHHGGLPPCSAALLGRPAARP